MFISLICSVCLSADTCVANLCSFHCQMSCSLWLAAGWIRKSVCSSFLSGLHYWLTPDALAPLCLKGLPAVEAMPEGVFASLTKLQRLSLHRAQLRSIPAEVLAMKSLTMLDLSDNTISTIPVSLTRLTNLQVLNVTNNSIVDVPPQIGLMHPTLKTFMLEGNILKRLRRRVLEKGTSSVLEYLRDRIPM